MASSIKKCFKWILKEIMYYVVQFFEQGKEHKLDINNSAVTSEVIGISERLMDTILKKGKGSFGKGESYFFPHVFLS